MVSAETNPVINPTKTGTGTTLSDSALRRLPTINRNFADFVAILQHKALWFSRIDSLKDPFEARYDYPFLFSFARSLEDYERTGCVNCFPAKPVISILICALWGRATKSFMAPHQLPS